MKKYKLKLDWTADELEELKELSKTYNSPMNVIRRIVAAKMGTFDNPLRNLREKYLSIGFEDEFDLMVDINNVIMGTAVFPENKYVVHNKVTDQYVRFDTLEGTFYWSQLERTETHTKEEWLAFNPAYESMLEKVEE